MLQVFLLDATTTFFGLIVFCQLFQLLSYLSLEHFRREYLISCHLVQCDVAVTLYIGGGGGLCSCLVAFPVYLNSLKKDVLATFFLGRHPTLIILIAQSVRVIFLKPHGNFFSALSDWLFFFSSRYPYIQLYPLLLYGHVSKGLETNKFKNLIG